MTDSKSIGITRRGLLGGLGAVGVASVGAALGTSAYFSDGENFAGNDLTAGELDLFVHYEFSADQGSASGNLADPTSGTVQGNKDEIDEDEVDVTYDLEDVKPGDSGTLEFCFSIVDNPAHLWANGELTENLENGYTEPEPETEDGGDVNDPGEGDGEGELAGSIDAVLGYCGEGEGDEIVAGTLEQVLDHLAGGIPLDGDGEGVEEPGDQQPFDGGGNPEQPTDDTCLCLEWEVPTEIGNEIQTDSVAFDLSFHAEQSRHNDGTANPFEENEEEEEGPDHPNFESVVTNNNGLHWTISVPSGADLDDYTLDIEYEWSAGNNTGSGNYTTTGFPADGSHEPSSFHASAEATFQLLDGNGTVVDSMSHPPE